MIKPLANRLMHRKRITYRWVDRIRMGDFGVAVSFDAALMRLPITLCSGGC
jgi:hypothetical protein